MSSGSTPAYAKPTRRILGSRPCSAAAVSDAMSAAVAPSVNPAELPAVTRPPARNGVRSVASASIVVSGRRNWSRSATVQPVVGEHRHRDDDVVHDAFVPGLAGASLGLDRVGVGRFLRQVREGVVEVLRRLSHDGRGVVDDPLGDEAGVEVDVGAHRVVAHVLDAAHEDDVGRAHRDLAGTCGRRGERTGAHAVDREAWNRRRQPCEERDVASEREALIAHLRGRGEDDVVDLLRRERRVPAKHLADGLHRHVVGSRLREESVLRCAAERRAHAVDVDHIAKLRHAETILPGRWSTGRNEPSGHALASRTVPRDFRTTRTSASVS